MTALFNSHLHSDISGNIGGITYQRRRGPGSLIRARAGNRTPPGNNAAAYRSCWTRATEAWNNLSYEYRQGWINYAQHTPTATNVQNPENCARLVFLRTYTMALYGQTLKLWNINIFTNPPTILSPPEMMRITFTNPTIHPAIRFTVMNPNPVNCRLLYQYSKEFHLSVNNPSSVCKWSPLFSNNRPAGSSTPIQISFKNLNRRVFFRFFVFTSNYPFRVSEDFIYSRVTT
jgi:hypothetical protein